MKNQNVYNHTINFTDDDRMHVIEQMFIEMLIEKYHPDVIDRAKALAKDFIESQKEVENES